jgi:hypothetical protein
MLEKDGERIAKKKNRRKIAEETEKRFRRIKEKISERPGKYSEKIVEKLMMIEKRFSKDCDRGKSLKASGKIDERTLLSEHLYNETFSMATFSLFYMC